MQERLPSELDPFRECGRGAAFRGRLPLSGMPRLAPLLAEAGGEVEVELRFFEDAGARPLLDLVARGTLPLTCQRCLEPLALDLEIESRLMPVAGEGRGVPPPEGVEPLILEDERLRPRQLVEDELLLALPLVPRHPEGGACRARTEWTDEDGGPRRSPFAVLETLKRR